MTELILLKIFTIITYLWISVNSDPVEIESEFDFNLNNMDPEPRFQPAPQPEIVFKSYIGMNSDDGDSEEVDDNYLPTTQQPDFDIVTHKYTINRENLKPKEESMPSVIMYRDRKFDSKETFINKIKVLCLVMTYHRHHETHAKNIKKTWGHRCNKLIFMSNAAEGSLPAIKLPVYDHSWARTKAAFIYAYEHHRHNYDWFLKVPDNTYVMIENLRHMLASYHRREPIYFGFRVKNETQSYMYGPAGYVLSHEALYLFVNYAIPSAEVCNSKDDGPEDYNMASCLEGVGVKPSDSRDSYKRERFLPFVKEKLRFPDMESWVWKHSAYPISRGYQCCSSKAVTFHKVNSEDMYLLDFLLYYTRPYGRWKSSNDARALNDFNVWGNIPTK